MTAAEKSILQTLAYSEVFDFPLTKEELWQYLYSDTPIESDTFDKALKQLSPRIALKNGYYALRRNNSSIQKRTKNLREVQKKLRLAKRAAYYLSYVPTISLIGVSGGVAMGNADSSSDIDFFIITKKNTLFMTRVWVQAILEMLRLRRKRDEGEAHDKICVNLLIDESRLIWPGEARDVYTAHEIIQMKPLFERHGMYETFLEKNHWVTAYFPNAFADTKAQLPGAGWKRNYVSLGAISSVMMLRPFEKCASLLQRRHMRRYQTSETVTKQVLAFHPIDYRSKTITNLNTKLDQLGLLTNN